MIVVRFVVTDEIGESTFKVGWHGHGLVVHVQLSRLSRLVPILLYPNLAFFHWQYVLLSTFRIEKLLHAYRFPLLSGRQNGKSSIPNPSGDPSQK